MELVDRYGLDVPTNEWPGDVSTFDALGDACETGVQAEVDNAALYDELFSMVDNPDIIQVFTSLQQASLIKHLPAFERCAPQEGNLPILPLAPEEPGVFFIISTISKQESHKFFTVSSKAGGILASTR